jgi:isoleucyl-tRNA synthetase
MGATPELKATLNLPKTDFPMKANLPQNEPKWLERWDKLRLYQRIREVRANAPTYILHDGPPYANGPIHLGTALNKCLKDFVVKSKTMAGFDSPYVPGWDCHGLPIEIKVDESLGRKKLELKPIEVRKACREYAEKYVDLQREQFKRIGVLGRFDDPYLTMSKQYESVIVRMFFDFFEKGDDWVYKGLRPVYWCIHDKTALAEAEVEYKDKTSPSIYVKYALTSDPAKLDPALVGKRVNTIIWTTTPWTIPASMAIAFNPHLEYVALEVPSNNPNAGVYIVAEALAKATAAACFAGAGEVVARFPGKQMEFATFAHPFLDRSVLGVLADYVTIEQGTGAVHTAPSHGADDFYTGSKYKLDQSCNVDESGRLRNGLPEYEGKTVFQANQPIIELLKSKGALLGEGTIQHSYPHCWRCHNAVIFRATEQWFISMEAPLDGITFRHRALDEIQRVKWDPAWGEERISNMIATRPDWCISRQRIWGVPIAVFFCGNKDCGAVLRSKAVNSAVVNLFRREGADAWYLHDASSILPAATRCEKCSGTEFQKEMDIIDVWFESGSSAEAVLGQPDDPKLTWPADLYFEGADQFRGWFHSSLLCAVGTRDVAPYRNVATSGWTLDPQGRAMHKSLGNTVDPVDIANRLGGEIVRLWVASVDFREDVRASEELMQRVAENYRKIRNTFRNILANLFDFDPRDAVPFDEMDSLDQYMLVRTAEMSERTKKFYEEFTFHRLYHEMHNFCAVDLSQVYFDVLKDRLYTGATNSKARRSAQTAIWRIGEAMVRLFAPMMSFTADEIWQYLPKLHNRLESVHLASFPTASEIYGAEVSASAIERLNLDWSALMTVRDEALKALEVARQNKEIGANLEAKVKISAADPLYSLLAAHALQLRALLIVSGVSIERTSGSNGAALVHVEVARADGQKCERCWNYSVHVGENLKFPTICERCTAALNQMENAAV